jgi:hypothetical protein
VEGAEVSHPAPEEVSNGKKEYVGFENPREPLSEIVHEDIK